MKPSAKKMKIIIAVIIISLTASACVSSPSEKQAEAIESANDLLSTGVNHYNNNNHELAISYFKNALHDFRSIDHQYGIASSCLNLSRSHLSFGHLDTAEAFLIQARRIITQENINQLSNHLSIIESSIAIEKNNLDHAKEVLQPLLNISDNNSFTLAATQNRTRIAFAEIMDNNIEEAKLWMNKFEQQIKETHNPSQHARLSRFKAVLSGDKNTQEKYLSQALNIYRQQANRPGIAATLQEWGTSLIQQKQIASAIDKLQRALFIRQSLQDRTNSLKILNSLATISGNNKTQAWIVKLQDKNFKQWDKFTAAFNQFPN